MEPGGCAGLLRKALCNDRFPIPTRRQCRSTAIGARRAPGPRSVRAGRQRAGFSASAARPAPLPGPSPPITCRSAIACTGLPALCQPRTAAGHAGFEFDRLQACLGETRADDSTFFVFANTMMSYSYTTDRGMAGQAFVFRPLRMPRSRRSTCTWCSRATRTCRIRRSSVCWGSISSTARGTCTMMLNSC